MRIVAPMMMIATAAKVRPSPAPTAGVQPVVYQPAPRVVRKGVGTATVEKIAP